MAKKVFVQPTQVINEFSYEKGWHDEVYTIEVGTGGSAGYGSDCYPYFVSRISPSGKTVYVKQGDATPDHANGYDYYSNQVYIITPNDERPEEPARQHADGQWYLTGGQRIYFNGANYYQDPHF